MIEILATAILLLLIATAWFYNRLVRNRNLVQGFPSNIVANIFKFSQAEFFEIELASQRSAPHVGPIC